MVRQYKFSELMARLTNKEWSVVKQGKDSFVFIPTIYTGRGRQS